MNAELSNLGTFVGALCFLLGAFLLLPERTASSEPSAPRPPSRPPMGRSAGSRPAVPRGSDRAHHLPGGRPAEGGGRAGPGAGETGADADQHASDADPDRGPRARPTTRTAWSTAPRLVVPTTLDDTIVSELMKQGGMHG